MRLVPSMTSARRQVLRCPRQMPVRHDTAADEHVNAMDATSATSASAAWLPSGLLVSSALHHHAWSCITCKPRPSQYHHELTDLSAAQLSMGLPRRGPLPGQSSFLRLPRRPVPRLAQALHKALLAELQSPLLSLQIPARSGQPPQQHGTGCSM